MGTFKVDGDISFTGAITTPGNDTIVIKPAKNNYDQIGGADNKFWKIYATTFYGALSGNASTATKLATARTISLTGSVTGSGSFDGSGNLSIATTTNHTHSYLTSRGNVTAESGASRPAQSGLSMSQVYDNGFPTTYGNLLTLSGGGCGQLLIGWSGASGANAPAYIRSKRDLEDANWSSWQQLATTDGSVNYATSAGSVAWSGITGKPSTFTPSSHNHSSLSRLIVDDSVSYSMVGSDSSGGSTYEKALLSTLCQRYPGYDGNFAGRYWPNAYGFLLGNIYNTSTTSGGLPQYSTFIGCNLSEAPRIFGTYNYNQYAYSLLTSNNYSYYALPLSGGTMTGALNFANGTWNNLGDDVRFGDQNVAGTFAIEGLNGNTTLQFNQYGTSTKGTISFYGNDFHFNSWCHIPTIVTSAYGSSFPTAYHAGQIFFKT